MCRLSEGKIGDDVSRQRRSIALVPPARVRGCIRGQRRAVDTTERHEKLSEDVDAILDDIDAVLETNSEEFVRGFVAERWPVTGFAAGAHRSGLSLASLAR